MRIGPYTVHPTGEIIERSLDGDRWHVYAVEIESPDGTTQLGTLEGDGSLWAPETLTDEAGNSLP